MCRSIETHYGGNYRESDRLRIRAFYLRLSIVDAVKPLPEILTLLYPPRINGSLLEINGAKIQPHSPGIVTLYRVRSAEKRDREGEEAVFMSTDRVQATEGVRFEVYLKEARVLKALFRKEEEEEWNMECRCACLGNSVVRFGISEAEVCVAGERCGTMTERVEMGVRRKKRGFLEMDEIPEEKEVVVHGCDCGQWVESEGEDWEVEETDEEEEEMEVGNEVDMKMEGVRWAVDLGIWAVCLGVGIFVSRASAKRLMRKRMLL